MEHVRNRNLRPIAESGFSRCMKRIGQQRICIAISLMLLPIIAIAQSTISGRVFDGKTKEPLPFATIKFGNGGHGMVAGLDGRFDINPAELSGAPYIEVSNLGYKTKRLYLPLNDQLIYLQPEDNTLDEVTIRPPYDKMRRILNYAIDNKNRNNPDKYDWYQCHVYYKMIVDATLPDSIMNDTSNDGRETADFFNNQHILMSETYSIRTWKKPQHLQEEVLASRFSGLKKNVFTTLITDVLPFHSYADYLTMNGKDYHNPVSKGFERYYSFNLANELVQGKDTVWALSFVPRGTNANNLKGTVYINSDGYAISHIIARAYDTVLKMNVRIEQEYNELPVNDSLKRWFPLHLNYVIDWEQSLGKHKGAIVYHMTGHSNIDSVNWQKDEHFKFDKAHTVKMQPGAGERPDSIWQKERPEALDKKEARTYHVIDSLGERVNLDKYLKYLAKLPEGKVPVGPVDMDIKRLFSYNKYEHWRLGMGLQTNERVIRRLSVGGWAGYGFNDRAWKYGVFAEAYADRAKEFVFRVSYTDDINDPGRIHLNRDLDKHYLNYYLLQRVDNTRATTGSVNRRMGYWNGGFSYMQQHITPMYRYSLNYGSEQLETFKTDEASLTLRYAYAERTAPMFDHYYSLGSRYPIWYGKITVGVLGSEQDRFLQVGYQQLTTAVVWHKHINRWGFDHYFVEAGKSWSSNTLPLSKLFAGNGYKYGDDGSFNQSLYTFGGMMTFYPYQYYSDQFVNVIIRHDFDWKLYNVVIGDLVSSAPNLSLQYAMLYGTMAHAEAHNFVSFSVPDPLYNEAGLMLNSLVRYKYANLYYLTINLGYFYHISPIDMKHADLNGRIAYGLGVEF